MKRNAALLIIAGVLIVAVVSGLLLLRARRGGDASSIYAGQPAATPSPNVVTLEEFGDYQCPPCGQLHPALKQLKQQYGANLNFIFRNLPLVMHKNALVAAQAAEAARMQDRFWEMHDTLYENQNAWKDDKNPKQRFLKFATDLGLDAIRFQNDMDNEQVRFRIQADIDAAQRLNIDATPTILINNRQVRPEAINPDGIRKGIELMMRGRQPQTHP